MNNVLSIFSFVMALIFMSTSSHAQENIIDQWADSIIAIELGATSRGVNEDILGAIDKPGQTDDGFVSLGGGWVELDMGLGEEIEDGPGTDFITHEAGNNEGFRVLGKNSLEDDWILIGDNRRSFDLEGTGLSTARFLRIEDRGTTGDGADLEAVEALYYPNDPWADVVIRLDINPDFLGQDNLSSIEAIGPPNGVFVSLPFSTIVVQFTDNSVVDAPGDDLFIAEFGGGGESGIVSVSADGVTWFEIGIADNNTTTTFDLASIGFTQPVSFVQVEGLDAGGGSPGFDLDAVYALPNSIGAPVDPGTIPDPNALVTIADPILELLETVELQGVPMFPEGFRPLGFESGDLLIALSDSGLAAPVFDRIMLYVDQVDPTPALLVNSSSPDRAIQSMFFINSNQIGLIIGPNAPSADQVAPYYFVRLRSTQDASAVSSFRFH